MDTDSARRWYIESVKDDREHRFKLYYVIYIGCGVILARSVQADVVATRIVKATEVLCLTSVLLLFAAHRVALDALGHAHRLYAIDNGVVFGGKKPDVLRAEIARLDVRCVRLEAAGLISAFLLFSLVLIILIRC